MSSSVPRIAPFRLVADLAVSLGMRNDSGNTVGHWQSGVRVNVSAQSVCAATSGGEAAVAPILCAPNQESQ